MFRGGRGHDTHPLVPGNALLLGGLRIERDQQTLDHSDADVLLQAMSDAL